MSWPGGRTPDPSSPTVSKSLQRFRQLTIATSDASTPQLLPSNILRERLLSSRRASAEAQSPSPRSPLPRSQPQPQPQSTSPAYDTSVGYEDVSVGTWNSPKELSDLSCDNVHGAPLPAPMHVIQAAVYTGVLQHPLYFNNPSLIASEGSGLSDGDELEQPLQENASSTGEAGALVHADPESQQTTATTSTVAVQHWKDSHDYPIVDLNKERQRPGADSCDINTATGEFLPPVRYIKLQPAEIGTHSHDMSDLNWRRLNTSSENYITREIARRQLLRERVNLQREENELAARAIEAKEEEQPWPNAHCTLRPVESGDFQAIAEIFNLEIQRGQYSQIVSQHIEPAEIATLYNKCLQSRRPFIVAVPEVPGILDRSGWSRAEEEEYQEFLKFKKSRHTSQPKILGVAFVIDASTDILACVLIRHRSLVDYNWICQEPRGIYEYVSAHNTQQYRKVYVETIFTGPQDPQIEGITNLLDKYEFEKVADFKECIKDAVSGTWKDRVIWELEARMAEEINEN
ncbi:hypothetical protein F66182_1240 [Fusarium sp. NRRL 66182]|nr:hypothetical protein F66182_1240 [Fusarium sp. NRRL 66182]